MATMEQSAGSLSILSVGRGDTTIRFDGDKPEDVEIAKATIQDMLKKGYLIFIKDDDGKLRKVRKFDPETSEYIVRADVTAIERAGGKAKDERRKMTRSRATAIAPTAGG